MQEPIAQQRQPLTPNQQARVARDSLVPVAELPAIFHHYGGMIDHWIATGELPSVMIDGTRYIRRTVLEETFVTARHVASNEPAEPSLIRRVLGNALADL
jgi:hypothetical protein